MERCFVKQRLYIVLYSLWKWNTKQSSLCANSAAPGRLGRRPCHPLLRWCLCKILLGKALLSSKEQTGWKFLIYLGIASNLTCRLVPEYWNLGVHCSNIILGKWRKGVKRLFVTFANVMHYLYNIYHFYFPQPKTLRGARNRLFKLKCFPTGFKLQPLFSEG